MSQALDPTGRAIHKMHQTAAMSSGAETTEARHVCPFCGNVNENRDGACPRCSMENTPLTRQATRARIGPWSVLQSRNPSAPGMKYSTLLALVKKGQVTPRSIVRGPTTHQLWRFASKVKGLSREFGLCWGCGQEVEHTAAVCPHCQRSQEPPAAPDVLVEGKTPVSASLPVRREIKPEFRNPVSAAESSYRPEVRPVIEPVRAEVPRREAAPLRDNPLVAGVVPEVLPPVPQTAAERRAALEAAAMREGGLPFPRRADATSNRSRMGRVIFVLGFMVLVTVGGWLWVDEASRQSVMQWLHLSKSSDSVNGVVNPNDPSTGTPQLPHSNVRSFENITPPPLPTAGTGARSTTPSNVTPTPVAPPPAPAPVAPRPVAPAPAASPSGTAVPSNGGVDISVDGDIERSRALWRSALDAERRDDPAEALKFMEQIKKLPPAAWPGGLDVHMEAAKAKLSGGNP